MQSISRLPWQRTGMRIETIRRKDSTLLFRLELHLVPFEALIVPMIFFLLTQINVKACRCKSDQELCFMVECFPPNNKNY